ncbi:uncharacterized protein PV09_03287 [Verruconis gallopava]|uniref:DUF2415 domain-containing protein n=1 Tax=Verruconis gallopava TaxID=253628 RepID=A0A0D2AHS8_9PEZI|nr:uncharacterized protein PV09_03287 [Verruconis gallopava]KIW06120.1 hypothetical protein PV09_03287 [Verruconis gallopava]
MTVDNYCTRETDAFVLKHVKYYPEKIPITHWQLRHFITNPEPDILYYASSRDIFALDTSTGVRTHITCLPFWARCTAAGYGYICVGGGDSGQFAVVTLNHTNTLSNLDALNWGQRPRPPSVQVEQAGREIVNSISIHKLEGNDEAGTLDDVVAVITNNDKKIRIFSLTQHAQNTVLELPFAVNHATISPDGRILVAVGDYQQAYFYERSELPLSPSDSKSHRYASERSSWELITFVTLHVPKTIAATGYFTTAWSPSGNLCAVASECGYVSVIDIEALHFFENAEDAIVVVVPSTRPENVHPSGAIPGAVRTMLFAPHPWDLLIWAEDQGRVCLADLRSGLRTVQVLLLDPAHEGYERVDMDVNTSDSFSRRGDPELEREYVRNFRTYRLLLTDDVADPSLEIDNELVLTDSRALAEGRSLARAALRLADDTQLTRRERELLESLRMAAQPDERSSLGSTTRSLHYSELANESRRSTAAQSSLFAQDFPALARQNEETSASTSTLPATFRIMRDFMRDRTDEHSNASTPTQRRSLAASRAAELEDALAESAANASNDAQAPTSSERGTLYQIDLSRSSASRLLSTLRASPHATSNPTSNTASNSAANTATNAAPAATTNALDPADTRRRRALLRARESALASESNGTGANATTRTSAAETAARYHARLGNFFTRGDYYDPAFGLRTAGLAMSRDGRKLWAACDEGIFEFQINVRERMSMAAMDFK